MIQGHKKSGRRPFIATAQQTKQILKMRAAGTSFRHIGLALQIGTESVRKIYYDAVVGKDTLPVDDAMLDKCFAAYDSDARATWPDVAAKMNVRLSELESAMERREWERRALEEGRITRAVWARKKAERAAAEVGVDYVPKPARAQPPARDALSAKREKIERDEASAMRAIVDTRARLANIARAATPGAAKVELELMDAGDEVRLVARRVVGGTIQTQQSYSLDALDIGIERALNLLIRASEGQS